MRLARRGDLDRAEQILRTPADAGDGQAGQQPGNLLAKRCAPWVPPASSLPVGTSPGC
jgi:hypothetical protein